MPIVGTSGHVDHGKTLLIEALTGINADRLPEERRRGMTIDLGFAHFLAPDGRPVGVIDVPGHERFIRNMVAGAWGLDLALLCVAADDGWMPQSADHARVLRLLGVPRLILVITKTDIAPAQRTSAVLTRASDELAGIGYPGVPSLAVSAVTGEGIQALRDMIVQHLPALVPAPMAPAPMAPAPLVPAPLVPAPLVPAPLVPGPLAGRGEAEAAGLPFLYVDRVFSVHGAGLVVTGSLRGGSLAAGEELRLLPLGKSTRVRGLQSCHAETPEAPAGSRVALNLQGLRQEEIRRGDCLARPSAPVTAAREIFARLFPPPGPGGQLALRGRQEVEVAIGTGHWKALLIRLPGPAGQGGEAHPTEQAVLARLILETPAPVAWGQPLVLIPQGGTAILGGGEVLWSGPIQKEERRRLLEAIAGLPRVLEAQHLQALRLAIHGAVRAAPAGGQPAGGTRLGEWLIRPERLRELERLLAERAAAPGGVRLEEIGPAGPEGGWHRDLLRTVAESLVGRGLLHRRAGVLLPGGSEVLLPGGSGQDPPGQGGAGPAPAPNVSPMGRQLLAELRRAGASGLQLPRLKIAGAQKELRALARTGLAVSLDGSIYYAMEIYRGLAQAVLGGSAAGELIDIPTAKQRAGLSRKYVIPLLNRMEADGLVRREGDLRRVQRP